MRVFAIADPHLSGANPKPMDIFGPNWTGHPEVFFTRWRETVNDEDLVLVPGDISWAMTLDEAMIDLKAIADLPGTKVLLRGNHDYWWPSIGKLRAALPPRMYALQNDALLKNDVVIAGTRGWTCPGAFEFTEQDEKIYLRELERLRLSLEKASAHDGKKCVVMLHYPPTNVRLEPSGFTELIRAAQPDHLVFGHIHGETKLELPTIGGVDINFVAADALDFVPKLLFESS